MARNVKRDPGKRRARSRISSKHQVTIPAVAFRAAGFRPGDTVQVEAMGAGQVVLTRVSELIERYSGALNTDGQLRRDVESLRDEWR